jgi:Tfp pilus assembly protein PilN
MIGVYLPPPPADPVDEFGIDEPTTVQAMIFAVHSRSYQMLKQVCANLKMKLVGLVPEEIFAFNQPHTGDALQACLLEADDGSPKVLVNWRLYDAVAALVMDRVPMAFMQRNFEAGESEAVALLELARDVAAESPLTEQPPPVIVVGGEGAERDWRASVVEAAPEAEVRPWDMAAELPCVSAPGPVPGRYMTALSAAVHVSGKAPGPILVNDRVPLGVRVVSHPLALPGLAVLVFLLLLAGDYGIWSYKIGSMENTVAELEERKQAMEEEVQKEAAAVKTFEDLKKERQDVRERIALLETGLPERQLLTQAFLAGLIVETPETVQLENVRQFSEQVWFLEGVAQRYDVVSRYVVRLKNLPMTRQCRLESSSVREGGTESGVCRFSIRIRLEEG